MTRPDTDDRVHTRTIAVQPREITEAAFRALYAAGADPIEAQEGALAVLRAEHDDHGGFRLLEQLLDADWISPGRPGLITDTSRTGVTVRELEPVGQPALRTALQLFDLAVAVPAGEVGVARAPLTRVPRTLLNDLVLRHTARLQRRIVVATTGTDAAEFLVVRHGALEVTGTMPGDPGTLPPPSIAPDGVSVIAVSGPAGAAAGTTDLAPRPLDVDENHWRAMHQVAKTYLVVDA
ncbi:hypothetical protein BGP79_07075 [Tersicoccus sp. Bi-70]|nr:hypothetical protein BGP79_07075 [Tersicoccus sp. Bi-70]